MAFGCKYFVLNNGKDDLEKFDPKSDDLRGGTPQQVRDIESSIKELYALRKVFMLSLINEGLGQSDKTNTADLDGIEEADSKDDESVAEPSVESSKRIA
ncbi:hypothetical protein KY290_030959 [Solanum tuberosum]|uniref:Uncharacterized protein n=1 Tax=Solanum tuberosum TaxID=4113 RepID=A0ABQ7U9E1_SOLTU|nr:hypothetical protein KY285_030045 [Solanum tuberosum]KAH0742966.1 hypothetical protein KY290_030959 [Solanum tuberosum]